MSIISAKNISIEFPIFGIKSRSFKSSIIKSIAGGKITEENASLKIKAIDDISFNLNAGDRVGLIGHNGSGKTTLLRAISGVYFPTSGHLSVDGSISSLLDIFIGMDMDATGKENIIARGLIMGHPYSHVVEKIDDIIEFSGLGDYINLPMRTYSSGMAMRLAFSASTSFDADIVLMDEWLSVGDDNFIKNSQKRIGEFVGNAKVVILASHDKLLLQKFCNKTITLSQGKIIDLNF